MLNLLHLGLGLPGLQNCEEANLLFKPPRLRYSVRAAWMDQTTCSWAGLLGVLLRSQVAHTSELPPERTRTPEYPAAEWENSFRQKGRTPPASSGTLNCSWEWTGRWLRSCAARNLNLPRSWTPDYGSTWHILWGCAFGGQGNQGTNRSNDLPRSTPQNESQNPSLSIPHSLDTETHSSTMARSMRFGARPSVFKSWICQVWGVWFEDFFKGKKKLFIFIFWLHHMACVI